MPRSASAVARLVAFASLALLPASCSIDATGLKVLLSTHGVPLSTLSVTVSSGSRTLYTGTFDNRDVQDGEWFGVPLDDSLEGTTVTVDVSATTAAPCNGHSVTASGVGTDPGYDALKGYQTIIWHGIDTPLPDHLPEPARTVPFWAALPRPVPTAVLPRPVHEVCYERLVDDFEAESRRLVAACGLEWQPACLRFHETARPVRTASVTQVRQPLYRQGLARWKHYEGSLADLFARLPED